MGCGDLPNISEDEYVHYLQSIQLYNFYMNLLTGSFLIRGKKKKDKKDLRFCCKNLLGFIKDHIQFLESTEDATAMESRHNGKMIEWNSYIRELFLNFTENNTEIWINFKELQKLRDNFSWKLISEHFGMYNNVS